MKTYMAKPGEVEQRWWVVDASERRVGRLASAIAVVLMGKHRPTYTPHVDTGDHVVVINADNIEFSGKKWQQKLYRWYTGYQGLKSETAEHRRDRRQGGEKVGGVAHRPRSRNQSRTSAASSAP